MGSCFCFLFQTHERRQDGCNILWLGKQPHRSLCFACLREGVTQRRVEMNLSLSVLRHLIKGKARCNKTNRHSTTQSCKDLCVTEVWFWVSFFESRLNVKCNFDIFKIFFEISILPVNSRERLSFVKKSRRKIETYTGRWVCTRAYREAPNNTIHKKSRNKNPIHNKSRQVEVILFDFLCFLVNSVVEGTRISPPFAH